MRTLLHDDALQPHLLSAHPAVRHHHDQRPDRPLDRLDLPSFVRARPGAIEHIRHQLITREPQGRAIPASNPGPIPPTPPRGEADEDVSLSAALVQMRDDERY